MLVFVWQPYEFNFAVWISDKLNLCFLFLVEHNKLSIADLFNLQVPIKLVKSADNLLLVNIDVLLTVEQCKQRVPSIKLLGLRVKFNRCC